MNRYTVSGAIRLRPVVVQAESEEDAYQLAHDMLVGRHYPVAKFEEAIEQEIDVEEKA